MTLLREQTKVTAATSDDAVALIEEARRRHRRRRTFIGSAVVVVVLLVGILVATTGGNGTNIAAPVVSFHGSGSSRSAPITTNSFRVQGQGITVLRWEAVATVHRGVGPDRRTVVQRTQLSAEVLDASSRTVIETGAMPGIFMGSPNVINANGFLSGPGRPSFSAPAKGSVALTLGRGSYRLRVTADGPWRVSVLEPRNEAAVALPTTWRGSGPEVIGPFAGGTALQITAKDRVTGSNLGQAFDAELFSARSGRALSVALERATPFAGVAPDALDLPGGPYYLGVFATGAWTITPKQASPSS